MSRKPGTSSKQQAGIQSVGLSLASVVADLMFIGPIRIVGASTEGDVLTCQLAGSEATFSLDSEVAPRFDLVRNTDGVSSILGVSGAPLSVPGELLQKVADELAGIKITRPRPFKAGQRVSVQRGPFAELMGIVRELDHDGERAMVRIDMLGKEHELELGYADLKVA
jgi:hypothetical protein